MRRSPRLLSQRLRQQSASLTSSTLKGDKAASLTSAAIEITTRPEKRSRKVKASKKAEENTILKGTHTATLDRSYENRKWQSGIIRVAGVDEAGRGPLAGPVVAAACIIPADVTLSGSVTDSKVLSEFDRETIFEEITTNSKIDYCISVVDHCLIDEINILQATYVAMTRAVDGLKDVPEHIFIDGNRIPPLLYQRSVGEEEIPIDTPYATSWPIEQPIGNQIKVNSEHMMQKESKKSPYTVEAVIKGDGKVFCIAAASILAKVARDRLMNVYHDMYPKYNLQQHKGYPTAAHRGVVIEHGPSVIHRFSYAPIKGNFSRIESMKSPIIPIDAIGDNIRVVVTTSKSSFDSIPPQKCS